jgi:hypothetical protein
MSANHTNRDRPWGEIVEVPHAGSGRKRLPTLRKGYQAVETPLTVLSAARSLRGWALGYHRAVLDPDGTLSVTLKLDHRGGLVVSHAALQEAIRGYRVRSIHSYVQHGQATVWLSLRCLDTGESGEGP